MRLLFDESVTKRLARGTDLRPGTYFVRALLLKVLALVNSKRVKARQESNCAMRKTGLD